MKCRRRVIEEMAEEGSFEGRRVRATTVGGKADGSEERLRIVATTAMEVGSSTR